jgi:hypothetical protein
MSAVVGVSEMLVVVAFAGGLCVSGVFLFSGLFKVSRAFFGVAACRQVKPLPFASFEAAEGIQTSHGAVRASAAARAARTQGDRIASLFGRVRTPQIAVCAAAIAVAGALWLPGAARADFGIAPGSLEFSFENRDGTLARQVSAHPYMSSTLVSS